MELAEAAVGLLAIEIVHAIGDVARLLRLQDDGAALDGVDGARIDLEEIARVHGDLVHELIQRPASTIWANSSRERARCPTMIVPPGSAESTYQHSFLPSDPSSCSAA